MGPTTASSVEWDLMAELKELDISEYSGVAGLAAKVAEMGEGQDVAVKASKAELGDEDMEVLGKALGGSSCNIKSIDVTWNKITDKGARTLAGHLPVHNLHRVALCHNQMGDAGVSCIAEKLSGSEALGVFHSWDNLVADKGAEAFRDHLITKCARLREMGFGKNDVSEEGVAGLIEGLRTRPHPKMKALMLNGCPGLTEQHSATLQTLLDAAA